MPMTRLALNHQITTVFSSTYNNHQAHSSGGSTGEVVPSLGGGIMELRVVGQHLTSKHLRIFESAKAIKQGYTLEEMLVILTTTEPETNSLDAIGLFIFTNFL